MEGTMMMMMMMTLSILLLSSWRCRWLLETSLPSVSRTTSVRADQHQGAET